jgi:hypothetical protein
MGIANSEVGYTSATTGRGDHEVHKGHVVLEKNKKEFCPHYLIKGTIFGKYLLRNFEKRLTP